MKAYLGVKLVNYRNRKTPLREWFDDPGWSGLVLPEDGRCRGRGEAARFRGAGVRPRAVCAAQQRGGDLELELHRQHAFRGGGARQGRPAWARGDGRPGARTSPDSSSWPTTCACRKRGASWSSWSTTAKTNALDPRLDIDFWDGLSSVEGYGAIRWYEAIFYKAPQLGTWDIAFQYDYNKLYSYLSRKLSNWDYAASRLFVSPFSWISAGPSAGEADDARPPAWVATQLAAFRKWGMGREFANFAYGGLNAFNYGPYISAMQAASTPGVVDSAPPALVVNTAPAGSARLIASLALDGTATDNLAVRFVRWQNDRGGSGTARMTWDVLSGDYNTGYDWRTRWSVPTIPLHPGNNRITITVEDIKGLATTRQITFANGSSSAGSGTLTSGRARDRPAESLKVGKVRYRARYKLARARRGVRIRVERVGTGLKARVNKGGSVKVRRREAWYVLRLKLPRRGSYRLRLTPQGGPSESKTIVIRVV